jgi:hypothetical protein
MENVFFHFVREVMICQDAVNHVPSWWSGLDGECFGQQSFSAAVLLENSSLGIA